MKIVHVFPVISLPQKLSRSFTYFTKDYVEEGSFVQVPFNKKIVPGVISKIESIASLKTSIKKSSTSFKKIRSVLSVDSLVHPFLLPIAKKLSEQFLEPTGSILKVFIPSILFKHPPRETRQLPAQDPFSEKQSEVIIGSLEERIQHYKTIARSMFARGKSLAIVTPTSLLAEHLYRELSDLPKNIFLIHGNLSQKKIQETIHELFTVTEPVLLVGTSLILGCLHGNEAVIIIEDSDSHHYIRQEHPKIKTNLAFKIFADEIQAKCIEGKYLPSMGDLKNDIKPHYLSSRLKHTVQHVLVDSSQESWTPVTQPVLDLVKTSSRVLLFINRKGFYSFVVCSDCEKTIMCSQCRSPLTLHANNSRMYICHRCQKEYPASMTCPNCAGWNLRGYGMGTQRVLEKIKREFPGRSAWVFDEDSLKNDSERENVKKLFLESSDGILIGTEMILEEPSLTGDLVVALHLDNMFSIPDFRIHERIAHILLKLEEKSPTKMLTIQTRFPRHPLFQAFIRQDLKGFFLDELSERKAGALPPYVMHIKITLEDTKPTVLAKKVVDTLNLLSPLQLDYSSYPSFTKKSQHHILLTLDASTWVQNSQNLREILGSFAYDWEVVVNPASVL